MILIDKSIKFIIFLKSMSMPRSIDTAIEPVGSDSDPDPTRTRSGSGPGPGRLPVWKILLIGLEAKKF